MGRMYKKKLAEYEAAESEELNKSNESDGDADKGSTVSAKKSTIELDDDDSSSVVQINKDEDEGEDEDVRSEIISTEKNGTGSGKKANKRKPIEKVGKKAHSGVEIENDEESDDDDTSKGGASAKKSRKSVGKAKTTKPGAGKAVAGRGQTKPNKPEKKNKEVDEDEEQDVVEEYEVKDVVDQKVERGVVYFRIRWKGYTKDDDTWEPEDTLSCPELIEKFKKQSTNIGNKSPKKSSSPAKKPKGRPIKGSTPKADPEKEWEVEKIIDYAVEKSGRLFRIRWKGFTSKYDTWEPEENLCCDEIIEKFMTRMKTQENITFKELRMEPKKTKRLVNETSPRTNYHNPIGRKSRRSGNKNRIYYGDSD